nr:hypothetical protein [Pseudodesulfovibrio sediminis]
MGYKIGMLSNEEAETLKDAGITPPQWQSTAERVPYSIIRTESGDDIGFIRFPSLPKGVDIPSARVIEEISKTIEREQPHVRLVVALSDWGWIGEQKYLQKNPQVVPDFLLGSGIGSGINGRPLADGRCVWVRPYDRGRSVAKIEIFSWPNRKNPIAWQGAKNYKTSSIGLNDTYKSNPEVEAIFQ